MTSALGANVVLAPGIGFIDLQFRGQAGIIATGLLFGANGVTLLDPGPSSCLETLRRTLGDRGIAMKDLDTILLTHIHLDHAGATGTIVRENPRVTVYVHERGARHLVDPTRLLDSARRLYGAQMDRLWGEFVAVPDASVRRLSGGERVRAGDRELEVAYTPGHAIHHVSYFDRASGIAFVGDVAGVRLGGGLVLPPTPPPDIDLDAWGRSLDTVGQWQPDTLFLTHFGPYVDRTAHLQEMRERLRSGAAAVKATLETDAPDDERIAAFSRDLGRELRRQMTEADAMLYEVASPFDQCWQGLARYWRKR